MRSVIEGAVVGLDIGTTSTICVVMTPTGNVIASASRSSELFSPAPGFAEADPAQWWANACETLREALAAANVKPAAICVTGMLPAVVALDAEGRPLRRSLQQSDARCGAEVEDMQARLDESRFLARTGQGLTQQLVAPKLRWIQRHEPGLFARIAHVVGSYDYINFRLTGGLSVERNWALEAGFVDLANHEIAADLVAESGLPLAVLPRLVAAHGRIGSVSAEAAAATGLPAGAPVLGGAADHIASALAAGLTQAGDVLLKFGGAGDIIAISERPEPDRRLFLDYHLVPGLYAPNGCMASSGSMLRWLAQLIGPGVSLAELDAEAEAIASGADGARMLPYFLGEKTPIHDPQARGTITGLSLGHGRGHIWRAALEAVACGFRHHLDVLADSGRPAKRLYASDGGSRSAVWMQIVADICGGEVQTLGDSYGSSVGAAWVATIGAGLADWGDVASARRLGAAFAPRPERLAACEQIYSDYRGLYETMKPLFARRAGT
jgi:xylulokinase